MPTPTVNDSSTAKPTVSFKTALTHQKFSTDNANLNDGAEHSNDLNQDILDPLKFHPGVPSSSQYLTVNENPLHIGTSTNSSVRSMNVEDILNYYNG